MRGLGGMLCVRWALDDDDGGGAGEKDGWMDGYKEVNVIIHMYSVYCWVSLIYKFHPALSIDE
jgi:hypothetical protein